MHKKFALIVLVSALIMVVLILIFTAMPVIVSKRPAKGEKVTIDIEDSEVLEGEEVIVTGSGRGNTYYSLYTEGGVFKKGVRRVWPGFAATEDHGDKEELPGLPDEYACVKTEGSGEFRAIIDTTGLDIEDYSVYIERYTDLEDETDFKIEEVSLETDKSSYALGEVVEIEGESPGGKWAVIAIENVVIANEKIVDDEFKCIWKKTKEKMPGSYEIDVWIYPVTITEKMGLPRVGEFTKSFPTPDGLIFILLVPSGLTAEVEKKTIVLGDSFKFTGTAPGSNKVNIWIISPEGTSGKVIDKGMVAEFPSVYQSVTSVSSKDYTWKKSIDVHENSDVGSYLIVVISPGKNNYYDGLPGTTTVTKFNDAITEKYSLVNSIKTQKQALSVIQDATIDAAGSDDLLWMDYIDVVRGQIKLSPVEEVYIGEELEVTGVTTREEGYIIAITCKGPVELTPEEAPEVTEEGIFETTFDTTNAEPGIYAITADDGDGHTDTINVRLLPVIAPAAITVDKLSIKPKEVNVGETVTIELTLESTYNEVKSCTSKVTVDGIAIETPEVLVPAQDDYTISIVYTTTKAEEFTVTAVAEGSSKTAMFKVLGAEFEVSNLTITPHKLKAGENITIEANVTNVGVIEGTKTVELKVDDLVVDSEDVTLGVGTSNSTTVKFIHPAENETRTYNVTVDNETGSYKVTTPGFLALYSILGLLAVAYLMLRRRKEI